MEGKAKAAATQNVRSPPSITVCQVAWNLRFLGQNVFLLMAVECLVRRFHCVRIQWLHLSEVREYSFYKNTKKSILCFDRLMVVNFCNVAKLTITTSGSFSLTALSSSSLIILPPWSPFSSRFFLHHVFIICMHFLWNNFLFLRKLFKIAKVIFL